MKICSIFSIFLVTILAKISKKAFVLASFRAGEPNACCDIGVSTESESEVSSEENECHPFVEDDKCRSKHFEHMSSCSRYRYPQRKTSLSLNKICEKSYKIRNMAIKTHALVEKTIVSQLEDLFYSLRPIADTSDIKINAVIGENLKKLERELSKSTNSTFFNISNGSQKITKLNGELLLKKQEALNLEVSKEAQKYIEGLIELKDEAKISEAVNDKVNGLLPNLMNLFNKMKVLNVPTFSDSFNQGSTEIQELVGEQSKKNSDELSALFNDAESLVSKGLSKISKNRIQMTREMMMKKIKSTFLQIQQSMAMMEDEVDDLVDTVSPGRVFPREKPSRSEKKVIFPENVEGLFGTASTFTE